MDQFYVSSGVISVLKDQILFYYPDTGDVNHTHLFN